MRTIFGLAAAVLLMLGACGQTESPSTPPPATQPGTQPAAVSSKAVEKDGLAVTVTLPKATFAADEPLQFVVAFKNVSEKAFMLHDVEWFWAWQIQFEDVARRGPWQLNLSALVERAYGEPRVCKPGETVEVAVNLGDKGLPFNFVWAGAVEKPVQPRERLGPGKYRLEMEITLQSVAYIKTAHPFWTGTIKTAPVEFTIAEKPPAEQ